MEKGPVYGVDLIDSLPIGESGLYLAMPDRDDLERALDLSERVVAGYEVLLGHYTRLRELESLIREAVEHAGDGYDVLASDAMDQVMVWLKNNPEVSER